MAKINLKKQILSDENIYAAIYSLQSYINEPNLLSDDDYRLYCRLKDKYDDELIGYVIKECRKKLKQAYDKNELFDANVYFKLKSCNDEGFTFRPIHTCDLLTQICIAAMLQPLMFYDNQGKRTYSGISQLMPENFYGNRASRNVEHIYEKWQKGYKEYSDKIIDKCREYHENKLYSCEINLDIIDFFPSVNPAIIIHDFKNKCKEIYTDENFLEKTLIKLLYYKLNSKELKGWEKTYYPDYNKTWKLGRHSITRGIPQGLPQAPFFGNYIMIKVADILKKEIGGDSLYYVDDSVIFSNITEEQYTNIIDSGIDNEIYSSSGLSKKTRIRAHELSYILNNLTKHEQKLQKAIRYGIKFHKDGKSYYRTLDDSYATIGTLAFLRRQVSMAGAIFAPSDEYEDNSSLLKTQKIIDIIKDKLAEAKQAIETLAESVRLSSNDTDNVGSSYTEKINKLKLLRRHLRYFKFREKLLLLREKGSIDGCDIQDFIVKLSDYLTKIQANIENFMEDYDEDIFNSEYRLLISKSSMTALQEEKLLSHIENFEKSLVADNRKNLYFSRDASGCMRSRNAENMTYASLRMRMQGQLGMPDRTSASKRWEQLDKFVKRLHNETIVTGSSSDLVPAYARFVSRSSSQYLRRIVNAASSVIFDVEPSDALGIYKRTYSQSTYSEFRLLAYVRNKRCKLDSLLSFIHELRNERSIIHDCIPVDMALVSVLSIFIKYVKLPDLVDNLIQAHRKIASLWKNGSKFLNDYTLHNQDHAICLIRQCVHLCKTIDYLSLKAQDYYPLFLACYLHDISMVMHPKLQDFLKQTTQTSDVVTSYAQKCSTSHNLRLDTANNMLLSFQMVFEYFENMVRSNHAKDSANYILKNHGSGFSFIDKSILQIVAEICLAHGAERESVYLEKSEARNSLYSLKYMKILLRLADLMDMSSERVSFYRMQDMLSAMSPESRFHWISHLLTERALLVTEYSATKLRKTKNQGDRPIIDEKIKVNIFLNAASIASVANSGICKYCHRDISTLSLKKERNDNPGRDVIKISGARKKTPSISCSLSCMWYMRKNQYLFDELSSLVSYLNSLNFSIFNTSFEINYLYRVGAEVPPAMLGYIKDVLGE